MARDKAYQRIGSRDIALGSPQAPDIKGSAYQAVLGGSGAIAQGVGAVAAGKGGIAVGGDVTGRIITGTTKEVIISYDSAFERVAGSTAFVLNQLELSYRQTREQSQGWYRFSAIAASIGFVLIAIGVVAVLFGQTAAGVITSISGVIPEAAAALFFSQGKQANGRVDTIQEKLGEARELLTALEIANTITDESARNEMKKSIVLKALGIESRNDDSK